MNITMEVKDVNDLTLSELIAEESELIELIEFADHTERQLIYLRLGYIRETKDAIKNSHGYLTAPPTAQTEKWTYNDIKNGD